MHYDIAVIGAGPAGLAFARMLADSGLRIALIDKAGEQALAAPEFDGRDIALTHQSVEILQRIGAWQQIPADAVSELREARVLDGDSPYILDFAADSGRDEPLGWLIANHLIRESLYRVVAPLAQVELITGVAVEDTSACDGYGRVTLADGRTLTATLLIGADSRFSATRRRMGIAAEMNDFGRVAIVCRMQHELPHDNVAWECFHYGRTLAILPMPGKASSIVITVPAHLADPILAMAPAAFNRDIEARFAGRLGGMQLDGERYAYPLVGVHAKRFVAERFALIGDAAVGMHPVTAHGFNLGLSGAQLLAGQLARAAQRQQDIGADSVLLPYQSRHRLDTLPLYHGTNTVVRLFTDDSLAATALRKAVMHLSNHIPPVKWAIRHKLMAKGGLPTPPRLPSLPGLGRRA